MGYPAVTHTFTDGAGHVAYASEVNTNNADIINGISDGTKDINVSAGTFAGTLTANGALTANGNTTLGNAAGDTIAVTGTMTATPAVTLTGGAKIGGAETLKIWTYTHTITGGEAVANQFSQAITSVTRTNVRSITCVGYDFSTGHVLNGEYANYSLVPDITSATNITVDTGVNWDAADTISITIVEAV